MNWCVCPRPLTSLEPLPPSQPRQAIKAGLGNFRDNPPVPQSWLQPILSMKGESKSYETLYTWTCVLCCIGALEPQSCPQDAGLCLLLSHPPRSQGPGNLDGESCAESWTREPSCGCPGGPLLGFCPMKPLLDMAGTACFLLLFLAHLTEPTTVSYG